MRVTREPVEAKVYTIGELRPSRSSMIVAPPMAGGMLQIIHLAKTGAYVQPGDVVVEYDPGEQEYNLEQSKSQLEEADQQIRKMKADQAVRVARENLTLLQAQYGVRRAELKVKGNDVLSGIEARKNVISLEEARRGWNNCSATSSRAPARMRRISLFRMSLAPRPRSGMKLAQQNIDNMVFRAPIAGIVVLGQNLQALASASGTISISSIDEIPEFKEGDQAYPGRFIGQIQGAEQMEITSKVTETDRASLDSVQGVEVVADSRPLKTYEGKIKSIGAICQSVSDIKFARSIIWSRSRRGVSRRFSRSIRWRSV